MEWIDVNVAVPTHTDFVILCNINSHWGGLELYGIGWYNQLGKEKWITVPQEFSNRITHWMPIPDPPIRKVENDRVSNQSGT